MIIRVWKSKECKTIAEYEVDEILLASDDAEEAREDIKNGCIPMACFSDDGGYSGKCYPINFVIEIKES